MAKAEAEAVLTRAQSEIEVEDLKRRAEHRVEMEEIQKPWIIESIVYKALPVIYDNEDSVYRDQAITFDVIFHLDDIGLIKLVPGTVGRTWDQPGILASYYGTVIGVDFNKKEKNSFDIGRVLFTKVGEQLAHICGSEPVSEFYDYVIKRWAALNLKPFSPYPKLTEAKAKYYKAIHTK